MSDRTHIVFLGPSLDRATARAIHPTAVLLPPAAMGDVMGAVHRLRPHAIGLVDGTFLSTMSVFHKELLYAIDEGSWVLGASSMGALRAAECAAFGVIGVGEVYEAFASGALVDDDEVALTHGDAEHGWAAVSDALVSIRSALRQATAAGLLDADEAAELIRVQRSRWFPDRRLADVPADALGLGMEPSRVDSLRGYLRSGRATDPKRLDAIRLLNAMLELPDGPPADRPQTYHSGVFRAALVRDVPVEAGESTITFDRIRRYAALHEDDFDDVVEATRTETALVSLALAALGEPSPDDLASARAALCEHWGVEDVGLEAHAATMDLDAAGLDRLIYRQAVVRRAAAGFAGNSWYGTSTEHVLNELRLRGRYAAVKSAAALTESAAARVHHPALPPVGTLFTAHASLTGWQIPSDLEEYLSRNDLGNGAELLQMLWTSVKAHESLFGLSLVDPATPESNEVTGAGLGLDEPTLPRGR